MPLLSGITGFLDKYVLGYALGTAAGPALEPYVQDLANIGWDANRVKPPDAFVLAEGVAQGQVARDWALTYAHEQGFSDEVFDHLVNVANIGPALGQAYAAWRRGLLSDAELRTAFKRQGIEEQWFDALFDLRHEKLDLGAIATAVHRGIMDSAGLLVQDVPSGSGNVPRIPVSNLNTLAEFAAQGIDPERARVLVADTGLPLSLGEMLNLYNRGVVTDTDVKVSIAESNVRNEYMDVALALARRLLTVHEWAEAELRGVKTHAEAVAGAAAVGFTSDDYDTVFQILGRPLNVHDVTKGLAHGEKLGGTYADVPEPYQDAIRRSNIRPEYARFAYANRYVYPSAFVLRSLTQAGELTEKQAHDILTFEGWDPALATQVAAEWAKLAGAKADPWVGKADTQLWTATHKAYKGNGITAQQAQQAFDLIGIDPAAQTEVLARWDLEKQL